MGPGKSTAGKTRVHSAFVGSGWARGKGDKTGSSSSHLLWGGCSNCNGQSANWEGGFIGWQSLLVASGIARGASGWHRSGGSVRRSTQGWGSRLPAPESHGRTAAKRGAWPAGQQPQAAEACTEARASGPCAFCQGAGAGASSPSALALGGSALPLCAVRLNRPAVLVQHGGLLAHAAAHAVHAPRPRLAHRGGLAAALTGQLEQQPGAGLDLCRQGGVGPREQERRSCPGRVSGMGAACCGSRGEVGRRAPSRLPNHGLHVPAASTVLSPRGSPDSTSRRMRQSRRLSKSDCKARMGGCQRQQHGQPTKCVQPGRARWQYCRGAAERPCSAPSGRCCGSTGASCGRQRLQRTCAATTPARSARNEFFQSVVMAITACLQGFEGEGLGVGWVSVSGKQLKWHGHGMKWHGPRTAVAQPERGSAAQQPAGI